ncbi:Hypothetical predicted protein [Olea europaea subsp. europaea]|uniref:Uncharacterized protein n=1 Tax=Olea europaea subsp. europaea TaxID=158383 RepID=A0A8S0VF14_OLEEU|nr:Hypothetical predicted protein [Olea europaea subsp. europaea]
MIPGGVESNLGDDFHEGANITDKGLSKKTGVHEIHVEYQTPVEQYEVCLNYFVDDLHGLSLGTYGRAITIDGGPSQETEVGKSHNEEQTPTMQYEASPNFAINADGMRRGKKVKITPSLLGPYEVDSVIRQIHKHNN